MTYVLATGLVLCVLASYLVIYTLMRDGRKERQELEDRLMTITHPVSIIAHKALRDEDTGDVSYIDEAREAELSPAQYGGNSSGE